MKVILLAPTPPPRGGIAGWTERMQHAKLKNGWEIAVVDEKLQGGREVFGEKAKRNIFSEIKRCFYIWRGLKKELKCEDAKVVQSCIPATTTAMLRENICALITRKHDRKFIIHFRCTLPNMVKGTAAGLVLRRFTSKADAIFVLNSQSKEFLEKSGCKAQIEIIPNFIENESIREKDFFREEIEKLVYVGGVIPEKGCDLIINAARLLPEIEFCLVGKNGMQGYEIPSNVILTGEVDKKAVEAYLQDADGFIFASRFYGEGFSNALAEAMAHGLPCIVTDWAANRDMIENKGGIVLNQSSPDELIKAIKELEASEKRSECGKWNVQKVLENYTEQIITSKYVDVYERLL